MIAIALSFAPTLSWISASCEIACVLKAAMIELGTKAISSQIANVSPKELDFAPLAEEVASKALAIAREKRRN